MGHCVQGHTLLQDDGVLVSEVVGDRTNSYICRQLRDVMLARLASVTPSQQNSHRTVNEAYAPLLL